MSIFLIFINQKTDTKSKRSLAASAAKERFESAHKDNASKRLEQSLNFVDEVLLGSYPYLLINYFAVL